MSDALRDALEALRKIADAVQSNEPTAITDDSSLAVYDDPYDRPSHIGLTWGDLRRAAKVYEALRANSSDVSVVTDEMVAAFVKRITELGGARHNNDLKQWYMVVFPSNMKDALQAALSASPQGAMADEIVERVKAIAERHKHRCLLEFRGAKIEYWQAAETDCGTLLDIITALQSGNPSPDTESGG